MKLVQLQKDLINKLKKNEILTYEEDKNQILICDACSGYFFPKEEMYLNCEKFRTYGNNGLMNDFLKKEPYQEELLNTAEKLTVENGTMMKLQNGKGEIIYINEKRFKYFDKNATVKGTTPKSLVYVYEQGKLVGVVMPFNIKSVK